MRDLSNESDEQLQQRIKWYQKEIDAINRSLEDYQAGLAATQLEIDRRALAAYLQLHPELERVAVGDKVIVTKEAFESKERFDYPVGSVVSFDRIDITSRGLQFNLHNGSGVWIFSDYEIVSNMRLAYLATQQQATKSNIGG